VYLLYFCPSWDRSIIDKQGYGLDRKGSWKCGTSYFTLVLDYVQAMTVGHKF